MHYPLIALNDLKAVGDGLSRPECALAHSSGWLFGPSWAERGGVSLVSPTGETHSVLQHSFPEKLRPNGIALDENGNVVIAHLGEKRGGVYTLSPDGSLTSRVTTVHGQPIPPTNFVVHDRRGRLWITVSTRTSPRADDYRRHACTGFIAVAEPGESDARIVANGLGYTNEIVIDEARQSLFVNETFARRLTRFKLHNDGSLTHPKTLVDFGPGDYPDGVALAADGSLWVTSIVSNRVIVVQEDGATQTLLEDINESDLAETESAYENHQLGSKHLGTSYGQKLNNISNLAFSGKDLRTACLGNLLGTQIPTFQAPVAGAPMTHWDAPIEKWIENLGDPNEV